MAKPKSKRLINKLEEVAARKPTSLSEAWLVHYARRQLKNMGA